MTSGSDTLILNAGTLHLPAALCQGALAGSCCVALRQRGGQTWLLPLDRAANGGLPLHWRSPRGDRTVHAQEFLRWHGFDSEGGPHRITVHWEAAEAALRLAPLPRRA